MPTRGPRKYDPLAAYLAGLAADEVMLTFAEIEAILGTALPPSARAMPFWVNATDRSRRPAQARAWRRAGWQAAHIDLRDDPPTVTFARVRSDSTG